jgi:hypothetical protein
MKRTLSTALAVLFLALQPLWSAGALLSRAAMVTETSGDSKLASKPVRTLQVFPEGSEVSVGKGSKLRLVYLQSGQKESVSGPCQVRIGATASQWLSGEGKVVGEQASGAKTKLRRSENIRRMGGSLQANAEQGPQEIIAMISPPQEAYVPRAVNIDGSLIRLCMAPGVSLSSESYQEFRWRGGVGPYEVTLKQGDATMANAVVEGTSYSPAKPRYIPGQLYELEIADRGSTAKLSYPFQILLPSDKALLDATVGNFAELLGGTARDRFLAEITVYEDWGLELEALAAARAAVKEFPSDAGFQTALGRNLYNLGELEESLAVLAQAKALEGSY